MDIDVLKYAIQVYSNAKHVHILEGEYAVNIYYGNKCLAIDWIDKNIYYNNKFHHKNEWTNIMYHGEWLNKISNCNKNILSVYVCYCKKNFCYDIMKLELIDIINKRIYR